MKSRRNTKISRKVAHATAMGNNDDQFQGQMSKVMVTKSTNTETGSASYIAVNRNRADLLTTLLMVLNVEEFSEHNPVLVASAISFHFASSTACIAAVYSSQWISSSPATCKPASKLCELIQVDHMVHGLLLAICTKVWCSETLYDEGWQDSGLILS